MKELKVELQVGKEKLKGLLLQTFPDKSAEIISLHGAGQSTKERILYLLKEVVNKKSLNAATFDFSGHGESTGKPEESSLEKRVIEAKNFIEKYCSESPIIIGSSMSGHIALRLLEYFTPRTLILFCPAIYSKEAYSIPFTEQFSEILRKPDSWKETEIIPLLEQYTGNLLIFIGTEDKVIPSGVVELIDKHSTKVKKKKIVHIPNASHAIHVFINEHSEIRETVIKEIISFI